MKKVIHSICILSMLALTIAGCAEEGVSFPTPESIPAPSTASEAPQAPEIPPEDTTSPEPKPATIAVPTAESGLGTLQILATDPPEPDYTSIKVTIEGIEVHKVVPGEPAEWMDIPLAVTTFNLLSLVGVTETLGSVEAEAGKFTQIRITLESVTVNGEPAIVPSGVIKIARSFKVGEGLITTLELDFDGQNSVVTTGRGSYIFKPVIHLRTEVSSPAGIGEDTAPPEITIYDNRSDRGSGNCLS
jgi:predicted small lipoprotein YifL